MKFYISKVLFVFIYLCSIASVCADDLSTKKKQNLINAIGSRLDRTAYAYQTDFSKWPEYVSKHQISIDEATDNESLQNALHDALDEFNLSHLGISSPDRTKLSRSGMRSGVGISIKEVENGLYITFVIQGSPAWLIGIRKGDVITQVDEKPLENVEQLIGQIGEQKQIEWTRGKRSFEEILEYEPFPVAEKSEMRWLNNDVAIIKIQSFQYRFYQFARINKFFRQSRNAKAIILDLRNNRGGLSVFSRHLASKVSSRKNIYSRTINKARYRQLSRRTDSADLDQIASYAKSVRPLPFSRPYKGRIIVLVDRLSASGADIFPAFIMESNRGTVIGEKTAGALQLARHFRLPYGFRLYTPIAEILTPSGIRLEGKGLEPNVELNYQDAAIDDVILKIALENL